MSIWSSEFGLGCDPQTGPAPYLGFLIESAGQYAWRTHTPDQIAELTRSGCLGFAASPNTDLLRLDAEDPRHGEVELWLDHDQAAAVRDYLTRWLQQHPQVGSRIEGQGGA